MQGITFIAIFILSFIMDVRFLPALEMLKQASNGRLSVVHADMLELDEKELLAGEPVKNWNGIFMFTKNGMMY
jgi:hypothetical protein